MIAAAGGKEYTGSKYRSRAIGLRSSCVIPSTQFQATALFSSLASMNCVINGGDPVSNFSLAKLVSWSMAADTETQRSRFRDPCPMWLISRGNANEAGSENR